jgi:alkanesulfonate monooxygenase SsuD/methylene tetrahydromethanopterin reductase-like flavin-dependent oxidoreductase (luciferase family)
MCDEAGLDLWVGDSVVAKPRLEPLTTLAYLAAITQRARLGTAVLLPALRQPTVLAHTLANIDQISHGRLVLGLGVGWGLPEIAREWEACGRIHKRRRQDLEEHIIVWRKLWSGQAVTYTGHNVKLTEHTIGPLPWHEAGPPILITAGNRGEIIPAQLDRFARLGDGIITAYLTDDDCRTLRARCEEALAQALPACLSHVRVYDRAPRRRCRPGRNPDARISAAVLRWRSALSWAHGAWPAQPGHRYVEALRSRRRD